MESYRKKTLEKRCLKKTDNSLAPSGFDVKSTWGGSKVENTLAGGGWFGSKSLPRQHFDLQPSFWGAVNCLESVYT
jgi:hypothetical protein